MLIIIYLKLISFIFLKKTFTFLNLIFIVIMFIIYRALFLIMENNL